MLFIVPLAFLVVLAAGLPLAALAAIASGDQQSWVANARSRARMRRTMRNVTCVEDISWQPPQH